MTIYFDFELIDGIQNVWDKMPSTGKEFFRKIKEFYEQRLAPLKEDIESQENLEEGKCAIVISIMKSPIKTLFHGYSNELVEKMNKCFSKQDFEHLNNILNNLSSSWLN